MDTDINYIIQESLKGNRKFQEILLQKLNPLIYKNINKYWNPNDIIVEDLVQEGYIVILESLKTYDKNRKVHFLQYIKINLKYYYKNTFRNNKKLNNINLFSNIDNKLEKLLIDNYDGYNKIFNSEKEKVLKKNISMLSAQEQKIIDLYYYKKLTMIEISKSLNIPYSTAIGIKERALKKLNKLMFDWR